MLEDCGVLLQMTQRLSSIQLLLCQASTSRLSIQCLRVGSFTSRFRSATTDFPFPNDFPVWPTAKDIERYWNEYCDHYGLRSCIQFSSKVVNVHREDHQWALQTLSAGVVSTIMYFDKLVVASGGMATAKLPVLEGIDQFDGKITHAVNFNHAEQYEGKNVLVVGMHASACDVAASLSNNRAQSIYLSHRHGVIMVCMTLVLSTHKLIENNCRYQDTTRREGLLIKPSP